ncbi:DUF4232 domain-containing protein [Streptomyces andamanensis]|uniref:DUF4232 domain-containing protein n=1 Tax=Streptomyces andamanensis TaxID=1565035 RepID=A0ABV8TS42_9ACTN
MRSHTKYAIAVATAALTGAACTGVAQASPTAHRTASATTRAAAPSACRPANHLARITQDQASSGHSHYRVTLTAPRGYEPCTLAGSPTDVRFSRDGGQVAVAAGRYGDQKAPVTFGPGHPVHFDIQVPGQGRGAAADEVAFTLRAPDGEIPGTSVGEGTLTVTPGTLVGPVQSGA